MKNLISLFFTLLVCTFLFSSCSRIDVAQQSQKGNLQQVKLAKQDSIPMEYGSLVGVTPNKEYPRWAQLWFQDDSGIIRIVSVGFFDQSVHENVTVIPRQ